MLAFSRVSGWQVRAINQVQRGRIMHQWESRGDYEPRVREAVQPETPVVIDDDWAERVMKFLYREPKPVKSTKIGHNSAPTNWPPMLMFS